MAKAAGVTVRTLHLWDELGLVCPSKRGHNGYRLYGPEDVRRLYQVLALRGVGLRRMYDREGPQRASRGMADAALMRWMGEAMQAAGLAEQPRVSGSGRPGPAGTRGSSR